MFQNKLASLKTFRQVFFNGFFYNPWPAKPINAPGSAIFRSPSIPNEAEMPPNVGSVSKEMYGSFASLELGKFPTCFCQLH